MKSINQYILEALRITSNKSFASNNKIPKDPKTKYVLFDEDECYNDWSKNKNNNASFADFREFFWDDVIDNIHSQPKCEMYVVLGEPEHFNGEWVVLPNFYDNVDDALEYILNNLPVVEVLFLEDNSIKFIFGARKTHYYQLIGLNKTGASLAKKWENDSNPDYNLPFLYDDKNRIKFNL